MLLSMGHKEKDMTATEQEHLPVTEQQPGHLPSGPAEIEPCVAATASLQQPPKGIQGGEGGTPCSEETAEQVFRKRFSGTDFMIPVLASPHI